MERGISGDEENLSLTKPRFVKEKNVDNFLGLLNITLIQKTDTFAQLKIEVGSQVFSVNLNEVTIMDTSVHVLTASALAGLHEKAIDEIKLPAQSAQPQPTQTIT